MELNVHGPVDRLSGQLELPGDKSISHRGMLLAALARGPSRLRGVLNSGVTQVMLDCLTELGIDSEYLKSDDLLILGQDWKAPNNPLNCGNSGTTMRLLLGALASSSVEASVDGSPRLRQRPMDRIIDPLKRMGGDIEALDGGSQPPFHIAGRGLHGIQYQIPVPSAQVKSGILLAALAAEGVTEISEPVATRDHTERLLKTLGVPILQTNGTTKIVPKPEPLPNFTLRIPGDVSSAAFPLVASVIISSSQVTLRSIGINPTRTGLLTTLREMGADIRKDNIRYSCGEPMADLTIRGNGLQPIEIGGEAIASMIDELPILAIAATQAQGVTTIGGASELRLKESDRILEITKGLRKMGANIEPQPDGFIIEGPTPLHGADIHPNGDHRIAMAFTVAGLIAEGTTRIYGAECIAESYPDFAGDLIHLGADIQ